MEQITSTFLENGVLGAVIVVLGGVVMYQQRKLDKKDADNYSLHREINGIYEKLHSRESERSDKLMETVNTASAVQAALVDKMRVGRGSE